jgi:hypothetical protein
MANRAVALSLNHTNGRIFMKYTLMQKWAKVIRAANIKPE